MFIINSILCTLIILHYILVLFNVNPAAYVYNKMDKELNIILVYSTSILNVLNIIFWSVDLMPGIALVLFVMCFCSTVITSVYLFQGALYLNKLFSKIHSNIKNKGM